MAYNTGNPIGSTSPKDLSDNARNLDLLLLGDDPSYPDRKGVPRKSWKGMEAEYVADRLRRATEFHTAQTNREIQFTKFLESSGYEAPVPYVPGLILQRATQTVTYLGNEYRVKSQFLPLLTTNWAGDESKLKLIGDDSLRQDMANPAYGAAMSAYLRKPLSARMDDVQSRLDALHVSPREKINLVIKPNLNDPTTWDWTAALQATIDEAFANVGVTQMYSANINHCQVVIDGGGYGYQITSRLQIPDGGGVTFLNGLIYAHNTFTATNLVRMGNSEATGVFRQENVNWNKWLFDCRHKTGGVLITNSIRCKFIDCTFLRYLTDGARTFGNCVEIHFIGCDFGTKPYKNTNPVMGDVPEVVGSQVGLRLGSTDNKVIRCVFHRGKSIVIQAQAQHISQCQFYGSDPWGVSIEVRSSGSTINDNAFGKFGIAVYSPFNTSITCNMFVMEDTLDTDWGISIIPVSAGENMAGYSQHGNTFRKVGTGPRPKSTHYDTTLGTIARVRSSKIRDNFHYGVRETCTTQATMTQTLAVTSRHTFDFSALIEFGVPAKVNVEFMQNSGAPANVGAATDGNLAQMSRSSVPVRLASAANGTLQVFLSVEEGIAPL